jgi:hypothetical protein
MATDMQEMPRIAAIVIPLLREAFPDVQVVSWMPAVEDRRYPVLKVRRAGGYPVDPTLLDRGTVELTSYGDVCFEDTEELLQKAQIVLWNAVGNQTVVPGVGYLHSYRQTFGITQFDSPYDNTWRVQSLIQFGFRPLPIS